MIYIKKEFREFLMWYCENQPRGTILKRKLDKFSQTEVEELREKVKQLTEENKQLKLQNEYLRAISNKDEHTKH